MFDIYALSFQMFLRLPDKTASGTFIDACTMLFSMKIFVAFSAAVSSIPLPFISAWIEVYKVTDIERDPEMCFYIPLK